MFAIRGNRGFALDIFEKHSEGLPHQKACKEIRRESLCRLWLCSLHARVGKSKKVLHH